MMTTNFEADKNRKALIYTSIICIVLLLLAYLITWPILQVTPPLAQDLIEVNLGNNFEGMGEEQPLKKGEMSSMQEQPQDQQKASSTAKSVSDNINPDENAAEDAAAVTKPVKPDKTPVHEPVEKVTKPIKTTAPQPTVTPTPKLQKPKLVYNGNGKGNGNNADRDNGFTDQGNNPHGHGDAGDRSGKPDAYGNHHGGISGGPKVIGNRRIIKNYSFPGDLPENATVYVKVKVSPEGSGTFIGIGKSTNGNAYKSDIINYLKNIQFNKSSEESIITVQFNFQVKSL